MGRQPRPRAQVVAAWAMRSVPRWGGTSGRTTKRTWGSVSWPIAEVATTAKRGSRPRLDRSKRVQHRTAALDAAELDLQLHLGEALAGGGDDRMQAGDVLDVVDADRAGPVEADVEPRGDDPHPVVAPLVADRRARCRRAPSRSASHSAPRADTSTAVATASARPRAPLRQETRTWAMVNPPCGPSGTRIASSVTSVGLVGTSPRAGTSARGCRRARTPPGRSPPCPALRIRRPVTSTPASS